jgi:deazaflavin-dependent oxidoreductase (nitroreductase family)
MPERNSRWWQRFFRRLGATELFLWFNAHLLYRIDRWLMRRTQGRRSLANLLVGVEVSMLTTTGARSGRPRTVPILAIPHDGAMILVASNWGGTQHPSWYHNLSAHPEATLRRNGVTHRYRARLTRGPEREVLWQEALAAYPGYADYRRRTSRQIPVFLLTPLDE